MRLSYRVLTRLLPLHSLQELPQPIDARRKSAERLELVHHQRQVPEDMVERAVGLAHLEKSWKRFTDQYVERFTERFSCALLPLQAVQFFFRERGWYAFRSDKGIIARYVSPHQPCIASLTRLRGCRRGVFKPVPAVQ